MTIRAALLLLSLVPFAAAAGAIPPFACTAHEADYPASFA
jgi:hypothetical protein